MRRTFWILPSYGRQLCQEPPTAARCSSHYQGIPPFLVSQVGWSGVGTLQGVVSVRYFYARRAIFISWMSDRSYTPGALPSGVHLSPENGMRWSVISLVYLDREDTNKSHTYVWVKYSGSQRNHKTSPPQGWRFTMVRSREYEKRAVIHPHLAPASPKRAEMKGHLARCLAPRRQRGYKPNDLPSPVAGQLQVPIFREEALSLSPDC